MLECRKTLYQGESFHQEILIVKGALVSIGQMAKMNNTTVVTLRHYDKLGLLVPRYTDEET